LDKKENVFAEPFLVTQQLVQQCICCHWPGFGSRVCSVHIQSYKRTWNM